MEKSGCIFAEYGVLMIFGAVALLGTVLLAVFGGRRCRCSDYLFCVWHLVAFTMHLVLDAYFLYSPQLTPKSIDEPLPHPCNHMAWFFKSVRGTWRQYADVDNRLYMDEFQPMLLTAAYAYAFGATTLCLLTFLGHLTGAKWTHPLQIAAATWHIAILYSFYMPEYFDGFKHTKDRDWDAYRNLPFVFMPFVIMPPLALLTSICKLCGCCSGPGPAVCPFASAPTSSAPEKKTEKKKKQ